MPLTPEEQIDLYGTLALEKTRLNREIAYVNAALFLFQALFLDIGKALEKRQLSDAVKLIKERPAWMMKEEFDRLVEHLIRHDDLMRRMNQITSRLCDLGMVC